MPEQAALNNAEVLPVEELARAGVYGLIGGLLAEPPGNDVFSVIERADDLDEPLPWGGLKAAAAEAEAEELINEYHALFIGLGRGELMPYGSTYLTGFLHEKPLADLREDLGRLGFERQEDVHEPEDHAGALCQVMSIMVSSPGEFSITAQKDFFQRHMSPWMTVFFDDLAEAEKADFYRVVGEFGKAFMELEMQYFSMEV